MLRLLTIAITALLVTGIGVHSSYLCAQTPETPAAPAATKSAPLPVLEPTVTVEKSQEVDLETLTAKASYILGYNTAKKMVMDLSNQGIDVDQERLLVGIQDALGGKRITYSPEEVRSILMSYQKVLRKERMEKMTKAAEENRVAGDAFRKENATKEGVKELASGIQIEVLEEGEGELLDLSESVMVDYVGSFIDGTVFDTSLKPKRGQPPAPLKMAVSGVGSIKAFAEVLPMMKVGSKWRITVPPELAYQVRGSGPIGPNETLVFEIDIKEKVDEEIEE